MTRYTSHYSNTEYATCDRECVDQDTVAYDWGTVDKKGRKLGAIVRTFMLSYIENNKRPEESGTTVSSDCIGTWFAFATDASRDGKRFGAGSSYNANRFATEAERAAAIEKFLKGSKARALKEAAKRAA